MFEGKPENGGSYSKLHTEDAQNNTASVNPGDYRLYVGGNSINLAFHRLFCGTGLCKEPQKMRDNFEQLHKDLLRQSLGDWNAHGLPETVAASGVLPNAKERLAEVGLVESICTAGYPYQNDVKGFSGSTGSVFIDVFQEEKRPLSKKNVAMIYVVGPRGEVEQTR